MRQSEQAWKRTMGSARAGVLAAVAAVIVIVAVFVIIWWPEPEPPTSPTSVAETAPPTP